jgi:hypothetical protein
MRKKFGFILRDPATRAIVQDVEMWFSTPDAREAVIRQSMSSGQFIIQRVEREIS